MPGRPGRPDLERAFVALGSALESMDESKNSTGRALMSVFVVNNEIGKLARTQPLERDPMVELQVRVNLVTVEVKRGRRPEALAAFREAEEMLRKG